MFDDERVASVTQAEAALLAQLAERRLAADTAAWHLIRFYCETGRPARAQAYLEPQAAAATDPGRRAFLYLSLGRLHEQARDYPAARVAYAAGLTPAPTDPETGYFLHNNLGYCLNHAGQHAEAETHCRAALQIDPDRHNAYKNLGIALEGQGRLPEAAQAYRAAASRCPGDPRAARHLAVLLARHPALAAAAETRPAGDGRA